VGVTKYVSKSHGDSPFATDFHHADQLSQLSRNPVRLLYSEIYSFPADSFCLKASQAPK